VFNACSICQFSCFNHIKYNYFIRLNIFSHNIEEVGIRICYGTEQSLGSDTIANMFQMMNTILPQLVFLKHVLLELVIADF
jgi:hypothetical protein